MNDAVELGPKQQEVVDSEAPTIVVFGGAGTGKTTAALYAARRELTERADPHHRILFLTFSRTAVAQILDRAGPVFDGLEDRVEILTFHGFAYRLVLDFGRYAGFGEAPAELVGEAEARMSPSSSSALRFDDLLPGALRILESGFVCDLLRERWPLVICDEFQDTGDDQWELLERLAPPARLLLLADPNQMIYSGFVEGVGHHRLDQALSRPDARLLELEADSHRDPAQVLPRAAPRPTTPPWNRSSRCCSSTCSIDSAGRPETSSGPRSCTGSKPPTTDADANEASASSPPSNTKPSTPRPPWPPDLYDRVINQTQCSPQRRGRIPGGLRPISCSYGRDTAFH